MKFPTTPSFKLTGKKALVTGASSGIGLACAVALAQAGAEVTIASRRTALLQEQCKEMKKKGWLVNYLTLDVSDVESCCSTIEKHGPFDVLVNSAGLARHSLSLDTRLDDFDAVINTNLRGAYFLTQTVAKGLIANKLPGSLINISSQMAKVGAQERAVYCATKHAVEGFSKAMAIELGQYNIRVNTICPTFILTDFTKDTFADPDKRSWLLDKIKLGRPGQVEDIMGAVVYLAANASALVTGSSLMVDGGWTAE